MSTTPQIAKSLDTVLEARSVGLEEADILVHLQTPEIDSLVEAIALANDIPAARKQELLEYAKRIGDLNTVQGEHERQAAGLLDELATASHRRDCEGVSDTLGVIALGAALRPHLAVVAKPPADDRHALFVAAVAIRDLTRTMTPTRLSAPSLVNQLGKGPHALLLSLMAVVA